MNHTLFISDLHLSPSHPHITEYFFQLLKKEATHADALYILGDLFETYIGDDENTSLHQSVTSQLKKLDVPIYFMHGNRDFLIGKKFINACGATLLEDPTVIDLYGKPTLLMHGDTLCTQDKKYLAFRRIVHNPFVQKLFLKLPLTFRQQLATSARSASNQHTQKATASILDVTPEEIPRIMQHYQVHQLIHGHTHQPSIHLFWLHQKLFTRIVLSDWDHKGHFLVCYEDGLCRTAEIISTKLS